MSNLEDALNLPHNETFEEDYQVENYETDDLSYVKDNLKTMISQGISSIQILSRLAKTAENPRAFEALATLMKTMIDANKQYHEVVKPKDSEPEDRNEEKKKIPKMTTLQLLERSTEDDG